VGSICNIGKSFKEGEGGVVEVVGGDWVMVLACERVVVVVV